MKSYYDQSTQPAIGYKEGDLVWVENSNICMSCPMKKLDQKGFGPFPIKGKVGLSVY